MKKIVLAALVAAAFAPSFAMAEAGDFVVRARIANVSPDEDSNVVVGGTPSGELKVDSNTIPEIDFSYYVTKNIAVELILATGTRHDVKLSNAGTSTPLGSVNLLPPTLTVQWHFNPDQMIDPYVGAGVNYTLFMDKSLTLPGVTPTPITVDRSSFGAALQAGVDINLKDGWLINADVKKVWIDTDVKLAGAKIDSLDIDPWIFGIGIGKKF